jgi:hypothetical protein
MKQDQPSSASPNESLSSTQVAPLAPTKKGSGHKDKGKGAARCKHFTVDGRQCRLQVLDTHTGLCFRHAALLNNPSDSIDLSSAFGDQLSDFNTAVEIHDFLAKLTALLVESRVSSRRASVLAYLSQLLLRTLPEVDRELNPDDQMPQIIFDPPLSMLEPSNHPPPSHPVLSEAAK